ncbi:hypothetical protein AAHB60_03010 [Pseudomonas aeruginosa]
MVSATTAKASILPDATICRRSVARRLLCNEARLHQEGEAWQLEGDPTEGALLSLGLKLGLDPQALAAERPSQRC